MCNGKTKHLWCVEIANTSDYTDSPLILHPAVWKSLSLRLKSYLINKNSLLPPHLHIFLRNVICQAMQTFLFSLACKSEVAGSSILHCRGAPLSHIYIHMHIIYVWYVSQTKWSYWDRYISIICVSLLSFQANPQTQKICLGESSVIEEDYKKKKDLKDWAGGGGGGGGATYIFRVSIASFPPTRVVSCKATIFYRLSWHMKLSS